MILKNLLLFHGANMKTAKVVFLDDYHLIDKKYTRGCHPKNIHDGEKK
jgi:hypothetical protein